MKSMKKEAAAAKPLVDRQWSLDRELESALAASAFEKARAAMDKGAKIGWDELGRAARADDLKKLAWLLDHGAGFYLDGEAPCRAGKTPLHEAVESGHAECVAMLAEKRPGQASMSDLHGDTPLMAAMRNGSMEMICALIPVSDLAAVDICKRAAMCHARSSVKKSVEDWMRSRRESAALHAQLEQGQAQAGRSSLRM